MSLLTQFYPGPGSGGGGALSTGSTRTLVFDGWQSTPGSWSGASGFPNPNLSVAGAIFYTADDGPALTFSPSVSASVRKIINNGMIFSFGVNGAVTTGLTEIELNGGVLSLYTSGGTAGASLTTLSGQGVITQFQLLSDFPVLSSISTDIQFVFRGSPSTIINVTNGALTAASVNHILISTATYSHMIAGSSIVITGGTNAGTGALTAAGLAAVAAITAQGATVTLNP